MTLKDLENENYVRDRLIDLSHKNKPTCRTHEAMLCVSENREVWRCPACNVGCTFAYATKER